MAPPTAKTLVGEEQPLSPRCCRRSPGTRCPHPAPHGPRAAGPRHCHCHQEQGPRGATRQALLWAASSGSVFLLHSHVPEQPRAPLRAQRPTSPEPGHSVGAAAACLGWWQHPCTEDWQSQNPK